MSYTERKKNLQTLQVKLYLKLCHLGHGANINPRVWKLERNYTDDNAFAACSKKRKISLWVFSVDKALYKQLLYLYTSHNYLPVDGVVKSNVYHLLSDQFVWQAP